jgi:hypothetical protein
VLRTAVLITTDETQPHVFIEELTGLAVRLEVAAGAVSAIEVINPSPSSSEPNRDAFQVYAAWTLPLLRPPIDQRRGIAL